MANYIDVFNGDADGIFSLLQLRRAHPLADGDTQHLITGVKRDIALVNKIDAKLAKNSHITVLDISFDKNSDEVRQLLPVCTSLFYCDHHKADTLFTDSKLTTCINTKPNVCTGLLINTLLKNAYPLWAITAAFGDGLDNIADEHVSQLGLSKEQRDQLKTLGILVNYNGYGSTVDDLHYKPDELYKRLQAYDMPFDIVADSTSPFATLKQGYDADLAQAVHSTPLTHNNVIGFILDDAPWARRISGTFGNQLSMDNPDKPVIIVTTNREGSYTVSLRAPKNNLRGASTICSQFDTGGGREGAAGINKLPKENLDNFIRVVDKYYNV